MTQTERYKLFALALKIKKCRKNGMFYSHETLNSFKAHLGMNITYNTFRKYWNLLDEANCIISQGEHRQLISKEKIAERLYIDIYGKHLNQLVRQKNISQMSLPEAANWVLELLTVYDFRAQEFKLKGTRNLINSAQLLFARGKRKSDKATVAGFKKLAKEASKNCIDTETYAKSILAKKDDAYIRTGSYHLSEKLNISQRKANRLLQQMVSDGLIKREVIKIKHDLPVCDGTFQYLKEQLNGEVFFVTKHGYLQVLGSRIILPKDGALFFPKEKPSIRSSGVKTGIRIFKYECAA